MADSFQSEDDLVKEAVEGVRGCLPSTLVRAAIVIAAILLGVGGLAFLQGDDDDEGSAAECPATTAGALDGGDVQLISFQQPCPEEEATTPTAGAGASDGFVKPSEDELPGGAILFSGSSAGPIGCIPCDGQSRFMSVEADGAVVGNAAVTDVATTWAEDGQITSFGARLSVPNPGGRYGINFFYADTFEYGPGVAIEVDETSAEYQWTPERDGTVQAGRPVVIIVGEGGNVVANGDYELEWWFVFQPD